MPGVKALSEGTEEKGKPTLVPPRLRPPKHPEMQPTRYSVSHQPK
jgi:hypothetical protein